MSRDLRIFLPPRHSERFSLGEPGRSCDRETLTADTRARTPAISGRSSPPRRGALSSHDATVPQQPDKVQNVQRHSEARLAMSTYRFAIYLLTEKNFLRKCLEILCYPRFWRVTDKIVSRGGLSLYRNPS